MIIDEIKAKLTSAEEEGADRVKVYDEVLSDITSYVNKAEADIASTTGKVAELTKQIATMTETNLKLLDKVKYIEGSDDKDDDDDYDSSTITIDDLFKEA